MQKMWVWSLGWEDPLEQEMATHSSILAWEKMDREPGGLQLVEAQESDTTETTEQAYLKYELQIL